MVHHELFDPLVHVAGEVVWEFRDGDVRWHDSPYRRSMGLEEVFATNSLDMWGSRLHADDAERVLSRLRTALHTVGVPWTDEYRLRRDDGEYAILEVRGYTLPSDDDHPSLTVGTVRDVTQERENERRLKDALTYADTLIQSIPGAVYHVTHDDLVMFRWNEWFAKVSGYTDEELAVLPAMRLFAEDEQGKVAERSPESSTTTSATARSPPTSSARTAPAGRTSGPAGVSSTTANSASSASRST